MASQIGVHPSTLRRWFAREALKPPGHLLMWLRLYSLAYQLHFAQVTLEKAASDLGLSSASNARRAMQELSGIRPSDVRSVQGFERFMDVLKANVGRR